MTDQVQPAQGSGAAGPHELIVVARAEARLRARADGVHSATDADVSALNRFLGAEQLALEPLFGSEERLQQAVGAGSTGLPDLALFYRVRGGEQRAQELRAGITALPGIDTAYVKPGAVPALSRATGPGPADGRHPEEGTPVTPGLTGRQGFLGPAPEGVDAHWARQRPGGTGRGVTVVDVIGGDRDAHGVTGIVPDAVTATVSFQGLGTAAAIHTAADRLGPGDLVLVGLQRAGPRFGFELRDDQRGCVPLEWWPDDHAAVRHATARGILVVAAAGNGAESLDDEVYELRPDGFPEWWRNPFAPSNRSSGAVLVGAGAPPPGTHGRDEGPDRSRLAFSNHGARVDAQGWGREGITGHTDTYSGTSAAVPIVAGALAALQGMLKAAAQPPMTPEAARTMLRATGSPQRNAPERPASQRIGSRPDIRAAVTHLLPEAFGSGRAEHYWDELLPYPRELPPRLRLFVSGAWRNLTRPSPEIRQAVHTAFAGGRPDVRVWFADDEVVGLVITG